MPAPAIQVTQVTKRYSQLLALDKIDLEIQQGEFFGLLGPNGAGKTTTISILCGLFSATKGSVLIDGLDSYTNPEQIKQMIGVVPQDLALYPTLTAWENLTFFGNMYGLRGGRLKEKIAEGFSVFGLEKHANKTVSKYSGGMKRRVNLIAGLLHDPKIIFLDEPTSVLTCNRGL